MAWTTPRTWTDAEVVTAAMLNTHVRDNENWMHTFHGCRVYKSSGQTVGAGNTDAITFDSEIFDTDGLHSTSSNTSRITIPTGLDGYWFLHMRLQSDADTGNHTPWIPRIRKNAAGNPASGTVLEEYTVVGHTNANAAEVGGTSPLVAGDHVELFITSPDEGRTFAGGIALSMFEARWLGA